MTWAPYGEPAGDLNRPWAAILCQWPSYGPRWWPGKSPHPSGWSGLVQGGSSFGSGLAHAVGIAVGDHDIRVMQQPVQQADGGGVLRQEPAPLVEGPVAGNAQGAAFVGGGDEPEQQLGSGVVQRGEPDFVDQE